MGKRTRPQEPQRRATLNRERVVRTAVAVADEEGLEPLTMRRLAEVLGVKAMSLYNHVANKDDLFDGMVDTVFNEVELPAAEHDWRAAMRQRARSLRAVLARHRWAIGLMDARDSPGPPTLRHHDAVLGCLRGAGFSLELAGHAYSALDSYIYGFCLQEQRLPVTTPSEFTQLARAMAVELPADRYPHLAEFTLDHVLGAGYDHGTEFEFGLDLVLDGLERAFRGA